MKIKELKSMGKQDLKMKVTELRKEIVKQNAQIATGTAPKNPGQLKVMRKTIARIFTILNEKEEKKGGINE